MVTGLYKLDRSFDDKRSGMNLDRWYGVSTTRKNY